MKNIIEKIIIEIIKTLGIIILFIGSMFLAGLIKMLIRVP